MAARSTILLKGDLSKYHDEIRAAGTIKPGMLLSMTSAGAVVAHATAGGSGPVMVAKEDALQGRAVTDNYVTGNLVMVHRAQSNDLLQVILRAGENAAIGAYGASNGDGTFQVASGAEVKLVQFEEALDLSGGGAVDTFVRARVIAD